MSLFERFRAGLRKTRHSFVGGLQRLLGGGVKLDEDTLDAIEELLIGADMGVQSAVRITRTIESRLRETGGEADLPSVLRVIRGDVRQILSEAKPKVKPLTWDDALEPGADRKKGRKIRTPVAAEPPARESAADVRVVFVVGVNGTGKTTSIAKLGYLLQQRGHRVLLAAGDTFRAAAVEQIQVWAERIGALCVAQAPGADPAAVAYDAINAAVARGCDTVIVDTAGRLHTKTNLMAELAKVVRVIRKLTGHDPQTLLVVDANTGQNGLAQARVFAETIPVEGLILTKLDGTAKGGIVVAIAETLGLPVLYVGMGETVADLAEFDPGTFADALFAESGDV
ncbi:MAG TPA: signal recognition particle-docking protein FtsY [Candidatus Krumholzibacteria bacterium]|nr:signal recognition particle-docking protein FtsY [Candidatus Krumholzibacteria bacterium]HPD72755.1 signal recognition particle-docking protein FtsY [Candidatus Krumholzibacteria bacterium]HRY40313.1 signal recognition particle-docking protein FtsY [Candidatus Krumholzibacteria bacterium]